MRVFFQLYKRYAQLAAAEALAVTKGQRIALLGDEIFVVDIPHAAFSQLGLAHAAYEFLFRCTPKQLSQAIARCDWKKHYRISFKITAHHASSDSERTIAKQVAALLKKVRADMRNPRSWFHFFFLDNEVVDDARKPVGFRHINGQVIAGKLLWQNTEDFEARKVHRWPAPHPTGTHPQLARAMVNLTGIERGELVDPFCGAGGTLIEAGLMGLKPIGYDIEPKLLAKAAKNLHGFGIKSFKLTVKDARTLSGEIPYLVADLPYGRNTPKKGLEELYAQFLAQLKLVLTKRAVLGFPDTINHTLLLKKSGFKIIDEFSWYINRRLNKKIVIIENPPRR